MFLGLGVCMIESSPGMWLVFATSWVRRSPCERVARCASQTRAFQCPTPALNFHAHGPQVFLLEGWKDGWWSCHIIPWGNVQTTRGRKVKVHFWLFALVTVLEKKRYILPLPSYLIISWRHDNIWTASKIMQASNWSLMDMCQWLLQPNLDSPKSRSMMTWGAFVRMLEGGFILRHLILMRIFRGLETQYWTFICCKCQTTISFGLRFQEATFGRSSTICCVGLWEDCRGWRHFPHLQDWKPRGW